MASPDREADALDRDVDSFLSDLIHDLRNVLDGTTMMVSADSVTSSQTLLQDVTFRNVWDVLRKTEDFRDRHRRPVAAEGTAHITPVVERALKTLRPFVRHRDVTFSGADNAWVATDDRALRKIVENILHVVSKFTGKHDAILISTEIADDVVLVVETQRFQRKSTAEELFPPHFQIGVDLSVSRSTARAAGGDLDCELHDDRARVRLTLPRIETADEAPE